MEDILHQLIGSFSHYLQGFIHPRWCRISSINSMMPIFGHGNLKPNSPKCLQGWLLANANPPFLDLAKCAEKLSDSDERCDGQRFILPPRK